MVLFYALVVMLLTKFVPNSTIRRCCFSINKVPKGCWQIFSWVIRKINLNIWKLNIICVKEDDVTGEHNPGGILDTSDSHLGTILVHVVVTLQIIYFNLSFLFWVKLLENYFNLRLYINWHNISIRSEIYFNASNTS